MILFICQHGSAKSVIAANHFNRLAQANGLLVQAQSVGLEPGPPLLPQTIHGMQHDGIDPVRQPTLVTPEHLGSASRIVSFECDISSVAKVSAPVEMWTGVPMVSDGYATSRDIIVARVDELFSKIQSDIPQAKEQ